MYLIKSRKAPTKQFRRYTRKGYQSVGYSLHWFGKHSLLIFWVHNAKPWTHGIILLIASTHCRLPMEGTKKICVLVTRYVDIIHRGYRYVRAIEKHDVWTIHYKNTVFNNSVHGIRYMAMNKQNTLTYLLKPTHYTSHAVYSKCSFFLRLLSFQWQC